MGINPTELYTRSSVINKDLVIIISQYVVKVKFSPSASGEATPHVTAATPTFAASGRDNSWTSHVKHKTAANTHSNLIARGIGAPVKMVAMPHFL